MFNTLTIDDPDYVLVLQLFHVVHFPVEPPEHSHTRYVPLADHFQRNL